MIITPPTLVYAIPCCGIVHYHLAPTVPTPARRWTITHEIGVRGWSATFWRSRAGSINSRRRSWCKRLTRILFRCVATAASTMLYVTCRSQWCRGQMVLPWTSCGLQFRAFRCGCACIIHKADVKYVDGELESVYLISAASLKFIHCILHRSGVPSTKRHLELTHIPDMDRPGPYGC